MAYILSSEPGVAIAITDPTVLPITFSFTNWGGYVVRKALLQGIVVRSQGNLQFMHTLRNYVYAYIFGERMGDISISGMTVVSDCYWGGASGTSLVTDYYADNCASWTGVPVTIQIGFAVYTAFLVGVEIAIRDAESRLGSFMLDFKSIPY